jgi:hypothetical protein
MADQNDRVEGAMTRTITATVYGQRSMVVYTFIVFHFPLLNNQSVKIPTDVSEINTPQKTPECCQPSVMARK